MLEKKIRRYKAMELHREIENGQLGAAKLLLRLLRNGRVYLRLDNDSWIVEKPCEELGCYIYYDRRGYSATAHL